MLASWNIRGKKCCTHNSKWPRIARIMRLKRIAILEIQEGRTTKEDTAQIEAVVPKYKLSLVTVSALHYSAGDRVMEGFRSGFSSCTAPTYYVGPSFLELSHKFGLNQN